MTAFIRVIEIHGGQCSLADRMRISQGAVSQMARGLSGINPEWYPLLAKLSKGEHKEEDFMRDEIERLKAAKKLRS